MRKDYKAVIDILEQFINNDKVEILGISVGEEYQVRLAIENLITRNKEWEDKYRSLQNSEAIKQTYIPKSKVREKIEILNNIIDRLDKELAEAYIVRENLGTEGEIDANEQYIYNMEQERSIRHTEKYAYLKLLEEGDK